MTYQLDTDDYSDVLTHAIEALQTHGWPDDPDDLLCGMDDLLADIFHLVFALGEDPHDLIDRAIDTWTREDLPDGLPS